MSVAAVVEVSSELFFILADDRRMQGFNGVQAFNQLKILMQTFISLTGSIG